MGNVYKAASATLAAVQAAIDLCADDSGDVVEIPAGTETWATGIETGKCIAIVGNGESSTVITLTGDMTAIAMHDSDGAYGGTSRSSETSGLQRVSGIGFVAGTATEGTGVLVKSASIPYLVPNRRIDNCKFTDLATGTHAQDASGVADSNEFVNCVADFRNSGFHEADAWAEYSAMTTDSLDGRFFYEDNAIEGNRSTTVIADSVRAQHYVIRENSITLKDGARSYPLFDVHGDNEYDASNLLGSIQTMLYNNAIEFQTNTDCNYLLDARGGKVVCFGNVVTRTGVPIGGGSATVRFREETYGYTSMPPNWTEPPGNVINDSYVYGNTLDGVEKEPYVDPSANNSDYPATSAVDVVRENVEYFTAAPVPEIALPEYPHPLRSVVSTPPNAPTNLTLTAL